MTTKDKDKPFFLFIPLFTLFLFDKIICVLPVALPRKVTFQNNKVTVFFVVVTWPPNMKKKRIVTESVFVVVTFTPPLFPHPCISSPCFTAANFSLLYQFYSYFYFPVHLLVLRCPGYRRYCQRSNVLYAFRPANCHGSDVSLTIFCHFSQSHDKAPNLTVFWEKFFRKEIN